MNLERIRRAYYMASGRANSSPTEATLKRIDECNLNERPDMEPETEQEAKKFEISVTNKDTGDVIHHTVVVLPGHAELATYLRKIATLVSSHAD